MRSRTVSIRAGSWPRAQTSRRRRFPLPRPPLRVWLSSRPVAVRRPRPLSAWRPRAQQSSASAPFWVRRRRWRRSDRGSGIVDRRRPAGNAPRALPGAGRSDPPRPPGAAPHRRARRRRPGIEMRTPSACSVPAPPSVDALPPTPTMISPSTLIQRVPDDGAESECAAHPAGPVHLPGGSPVRLRRRVPPRLSNRAPHTRSQWAEPSARWSSPRRATRPAATAAATVPSSAIGHRRPT